MKWLRNLLGCKEDFYKSLLELEEERTKLYQEDRIFQKQSFDDLRELFFEAVPEVKKIYDDADKELNVMGRVDNKDY